MAGFLYKSLQKTAAKFPDKPILVYEDQSLTTTDFLNEVKCCASFLKKNDFKKGDVVFNALGNTIEFCALLYAANALGVIVIPISTKIKIDGFTNLFNQLMPKLVFFDDTVQPFVKDLLPVEKRISLRLFSDYRAYDRLEIEDDDSIKGSDTAVIMFTSGTTSAPKGAMISNDNLEAAAAAYKDGLKLTSDDSTILAVPIFHITGLSAILALFIDLGGTIYLENRFHADKILSLIREHNVTFLHGSPTVFAILHSECLKGGTGSLPSLRSIACGAGRLNEGIIRSLNKLFPNAQIHSIYGLTESTSPFTIFRGDVSKTEKCQSSGTPSLGAKVSIRNENGQELPTGETGLIYIAGPMVIKQYYPVTETTKKLFSGEFLNTGDVGYVNAQGELFIKDRVKDIINRGGEKVFCPEVESIISNFPNVVEVALVAKKDNLYGEVPVAFILTQPGAEFNADDFRLYLHAHLASYQRPVEIYYVQELPRTNNGKINKRELRSRLEDDCSDLSDKQPKKLKVVVAMDSFKGSCSAFEAGEAVKKGILNVRADAEVLNLPISDGGEGLIEALEQPLLLDNFKKTTLEVTGAYGEKTSCAFMCNTHSAVLEMAQSCGIWKYDRAKLDARETTTYGLGQTVAYALQHGIRFFKIGLGGSATNDGGAGFAQALGAKFYDKDHALLPSPIKSKDLARIASVDMSDFNQDVLSSDFIGTCDVTNPLLGENGATYIFGKQKGASSEVLQELEDGMKNYAKVLTDYFHKDCADIAGAGAAGGMGAALMFFCNAKLQSGIDTVLDLLKFDEKLKGSNLVIVGEGRMDGQSINGKAPVGVSLRAQKQNIPAIAICGSHTDDAKALYNCNIQAMFSICDGPMALEQSIKNAEKLIEKTAENAIRVYCLK